MISLKLVKEKIIKGEDGGRERGQGRVVYRRRDLPEHHFVLLSIISCASPSRPQADSLGGRCYLFCAKYSNTHDHVIFFSSYLDTYSCLITVIETSFVPLEMDLYYPHVHFYLHLSSFICHLSIGKVLLVLSCGILMQKFLF